MAYSVTKTHDTNEGRIWIYYYDDNSWGADYAQRKIFNILEEANSVAYTNGGKVIDENLNISN